MATPDSGDSSSEKAPDGPVARTNAHAGLRTIDMSTPNTPARESSLSAHEYAALHDNVADISAEPMVREPATPARPMRTLIANNVVVNDFGDTGSVLVPYHGFFGPSDNHPLSLHDFGRCKAIIARCEKMVDARTAHVDHMHKDPAIFLPGHVWAGQFRKTYFNAIARGDYNVINNLRLFVYCFSDYRLLEFQTAHGLPVLEHLPPDLDAVIRQNAATAQGAEPFGPFTKAFLELIREIPDRRWIVSPPRLMCEVGWEVGGIIANFDTWAHQTRINAMLSSGLIEHIQNQIDRHGACRIVEIGSGYGGLAYHLKRMFGPKLQYILVDLAESLAFSVPYLTATCGEDVRVDVADSVKASFIEDNNIVGVPSHFFDEYVDHIKTADAVINTLSFTEMAPPQINFYGRAARHLIGKSGVLFEMNFQHTGIHSDAYSIFKSIFPYHQRMPQTTLDSGGRGTTHLWTNTYLAKFFDRSDEYGMLRYRVGAPYS